MNALKIRKTIMIFMTAFALCFGIMTINEKAYAEDENEETIDYSRKSDDTVKFSLSNKGVLTISGTGAVGNEYANNTKVKKVVIKKGITQLQLKAFYNCTNLTTVSLPEEFTYLGSYAFQDCKNLKSINIPTSVKAVCIGAFMNCTSLESISLDCKVTVIECNVFENCTNLKSVTLGEGVKEIWSYAFKKSGITSITLPENLDEIDDGAFCGCKNLESITIPDKITNIPDECFYYCSSLKSITLPDKLENIGDESFS